MSVKHTEGPWYFDGQGAIWRRPPSDLYENGGEVAGDRPIATVHIGWHHDGAIGYPVEANARLMAAAPELLEARENQFDLSPLEAAEQLCAVYGPAVNDPILRGNADLVSEHGSLGRAA